MAAAPPRDSCKRSKKCTSTKATRRPGKSDECHSDYLVNIICCKYHYYGSLIWLTEARTYFRAHKKDIKNYIGDSHVHDLLSRCDLERMWSEDCVDDVECVKGCQCGERSGRCIQDSSDHICSKRSDASEAHETFYGGLFEDYEYDYAPISQWNDNDDDVHVSDSIVLDGSHNFNGFHREMALSAIALLVITCCLFACCVIVWSAFLCVFKRSNENKRSPPSSYDAIIASDRDQV
eukprot:248611_1